MFARPVVPMIFLSVGNSSLGLVRGCGKHVERQFSPEP
jgi:hypothetical protein